MTLRVLLLFLVIIGFGLILTAAGSSDGATNTPAPSATLSEQVDAVTDSALDSLGQAVSGVTHAVTHDPEVAGMVGSRTRALLDQTIFGFSLGQLSMSFFLLLATLVFRRLLTNLLFARLLRFANRTSTPFDGKAIDALHRPVSTFILLIGVYLAALALPLEAEIDELLGNLFRGTTMVIAVWAGLRLTDVFGDFLAATLSSRRDSAIFGFIPLIKKTLKIFVITVGVLMAVDNLGYNVTGIIATLGLGTAAIALAAQDTLKNGFGALMIVLDRPFKVGDWIQVGDKVDGNVESIGLRSTKVRTWPKTILSIPNGLLANEYINNWTLMPKRRVKQVVGITYEATAEDMEGLVEDFRQILKNDPGVNQEFILVNFTDFGESSLDILVYYFTNTIAWLEYMDIRQRINCAIMKAVRARGLSVAFPTRSVYFEGPVAHRMAEMDFAARGAPASPP